MSQRKNQTIVLPISKLATEENINASKGMKYRRQRVFEREITTATYVDSYIFDKRLFKKALFDIAEIGGLQSIYYKILACIDPDDWFEILGETALALSSHAAHTVTDPWAYVKIQIKSNSGAGTVRAFISGQTP